MEKKEKKQRGRPPKPMPEQIPDTFENVVKALVRPVEKKKPTESED